MHASPTCTMTMGDHGGLMFGVVTNDTLYFRVDDHNRVAFKEAESVPPLSYEKKNDRRARDCRCRIRREARGLYEWPRAAHRH